MLGRARDWGWGAPFGVRTLTRIDALLAVVLSAGVVLVVSSGNPHGGVWPCLAALTMTVPVAWRGRAPLAAIAALAAGALFNGIVVGSYVRCGAALPALALVAYSVGARLELKVALLGLALGWVSAIGQAGSDPRLKGFTIGAMVFALALWGLGRLVRSRDGIVARLQAQTDELRAQRERTARLAVEADRARVAEQLDGMLGARLGALATEASTAREALDEHPEAARESFAAIEHEGRETLHQMREIVGALGDEPPLTPQPSLADLRTRLETGARLSIEGEPSRLPPGLELAAFRIVERLLEPLDGVAASRLHVTLRYRPDVLEVDVRGPVRADADLQKTLAAVREWVSLHAGSVEVQSPQGFSHVNVRLPLLAAHA